MRAVSSWKAALLSASGALVAVPTGFIPVAVVYLAIAKPGEVAHIAFPWTTILQLLIAAPLIAAGRGVRGQQPGAKGPARPGCRRSRRTELARRRIRYRLPMRGARRKPTVAIIGAGAGGLATGIKLKRAGYEFTIYEKADGVGGTWRHNTYPGAQCDVPSHLYSFSFELNPWWSRTYATQPEILAYLERCTDQYGLRPHLRTGTGIIEARWDETQQHWNLRSEAGETFTADVVVSGLGMLNVPVVPEIPGADRFRGRAFHSSRWDHSKSVEGERVASIGTGASAVQYVPAIAPLARARHRLPAFADLDHAPHRPSVHRGGATPVRARSRRGAASRAGRSGGRTNSRTSRPRRNRQ